MIPSDYTSNINKDKVAVARFFVDGEMLLEPRHLTELAIAEGMGACLGYELQLRQMPLDAKLQNYLKEQSLQNILQEKTLHDVASAFRKAAIPCIWLKGTALAYTVYPEASMRLKNDLDCLVTPQDFLAAKKILLGMKFHEPDYSLKVVARERLMHHSYLVHQRYPQVIFELHHRLLGPKGDDWMPPEILARWFDQPLDFGNGLKSLQPEYHFLYICAHLFLQHGEAYIRLRDYYDLWLMLRQYRMDWDLMIAEAVGLKWTFLLAYALRHLQAYFPCEIPEMVYTRLDSFDKKDEAVDAILLKADADNRGEIVLEYFAHYSLRESLEKIRQLLFPSPAYLRERYEIPANRSALPYYAYRFFDQTRGLLKALIRRAKYRFWRKSSSGMNENHPHA